MPDTPKDFRPKSYRKPKKQQGSPDKRTVGWDRSRQRDRILRVQEYTCQSCLEVFPKQELIVDHRIPLYKGGKELDRDENLQLLCTTCDLIKQKIEQAERSGKTPDFFLSHLLSQLSRVKTPAVPISDELRRAHQRFIREQLEV